jgi:hypothetical protein
MKIWSTIKLVIISMVALVALTFLTVDAPKKIEKVAINIENLPDTVELIGFEEQKFNTNSIIKPESIIFVGNHESIILAKTLDEMLDLDAGDFIIVSNISKEPWFIKRWQAHTQNTKLKGDKQLPWIYDRDGSVRNFLQVPTSDALKYFVYNVRKDGIIENIHIGKIKVGTNSGTMSKKEIEENLQEVVEKVNKLNY